MADARLNLLSSALYDHCHVYLNLGDRISVFIISGIKFCHTNPCSPDATCQDREGSFSCACNIGFVGNGVSCLGKIRIPILYYIHELGYIFASVWLNKGQLYSRQMNFEINLKHFI